MVAKHLEKRSIIVKQHISGGLEAAEYGPISIPTGWVFIKVEDVPLCEMLLLPLSGPVWTWREERAGLSPEIRGWYLPPWLAALVLRKTGSPAKAEQVLAEREKWLVRREHERQNLTVLAVGDWDRWKENGVKEGVFNTSIAVPDGWTLLKSGDPLLTRRVKSRGQYWTYEQHTGRFTKNLGILAPSEIIEEEQQKVERERTSEAYQRRLQTQRQRRDQQEEKYLISLEAAIVSYLDFAPEHYQLALEIAEKAAAHSSEVSSGRVGRTQKLTLKEKAALAARAYIRHKYTSYDDQLIKYGLGPDSLYHDVKRDAQEEVEAFLGRHRRPQ